MKEQVVREIFRCDACNERVPAKKKISRFSDLAFCDEKCREYFEKKLQKLPIKERA